MSNVRLRFKVPSVQDNSQQNFIGLLNYEIEKSKHELDRRIVIEKNDLESEIKSMLDQDVQSLINNSKTFIDTRSVQAVAFINQDTDSKLTILNNESISVLGTRAAQSTVDTLHEFARVVDSAIEIGQFEYTGTKQGIMDSIGNIISNFGFDDSNINSWTISAIPLKWNISSTFGVTELRISNTDTQQVIKTLSPSTTSTVISGLSPDTSYNFSIQAFNIGTSNTPVTLVTSTMSDATVSGLQVISASTTSTSISLQWTHQNNRNYTIRYSTLSNFSSFESVQSNDTETTTISGLSSSTQYYFRIAIKFTNYTGIFSSDVISGTTLAAQVSQGTLSLSFITNHDVQLINSNVSIIDGKRTFVFSAAGSGFLYITGLRFSDITNIPNETVVRITNTSLNTLYFRDKTWAMGGTWSSEQYSFNFGSYQQKQIGQDQSLDLTYSQGEQNWV